MRHDDGIKINNNNNHVLQHRVSKNIQYPIRTTQFIVKNDHGHYDMTQTTTM